MVDLKIIFYDMAYESAEGTSSPIVNPELYHICSLHLIKEIK